MKANTFVFVNKAPISELRTHVRFLFGIDAQDWSADRCINEIQSVGEHVLAADSTGWVLGYTSYLDKNFLDGQRITCLWNKHSNSALVISGGKSVELPAEGRNEAYRKFIIDHTNIRF